MVIVPAGVAGLSVVVVRCGVGGATAPCCGDAAAGVTWAAGEDEAPSGEAEDEGEGEVPAGDGEEAGGEGVGDCE